MFIHVNEETGVVRKVKDPRKLHWTDPYMDTGNLIPFTEKGLVRLASVILAASVKDSEVSDGNE